MTKEKTTSYRLAEMTLNQIDTLAAATGLSKANVVQTAIDRMHQQETQTMTRTIEAAFKRSDLPEWAQNDDDIYERCVNSLSFRAEVFSAETAQRQRQIRTANRRFMEELRNR